MIVYKRNLPFVHRLKIRERKEPIRGMVIFLSPLGTIAFGHRYSASHGNI